MSRKIELENELTRIKKLIIEKYNPDKVILFGSLVNGNVHDWSDIDLVVVKDSKKKFTDRIYELLQLIRPNLALNIIIYTPKEVLDMERNKNYFWLNEICTKGNVIYG